VAAAVNSGLFSSFYSRQRIYLFWPGTPARVRASCASVAAVLDFGKKKKRRRKKKQLESPLDLARSITVLRVGFSNTKSFWDSSADSLDRAMAVLGLLCAFAGRSGRSRVHWSRGGPGGDGGTSRSAPLCRLAGQKTVSVAPKRPKIAIKRDHFGRPFRTEPAAPRTANARFPSPNDVNRWDQSSVPLFEAA
jgi:hypothetical protein